MAEYADSSQLNLWMYKSIDQLSSLRSQANFRAREFLYKLEEETISSDVISTPNLLTETFARGFRKRVEDGKETEQNYDSQEPLKSKKGNDYLTPEEEATLVTFYASKLLNLIGPKSTISRLRRESKVTATAAMLLRRFYLSNSVMIHDPKAIMVAAAFLASKVEDATADVRYLEEGTNAMNAPVTQQEILPAELALITGVNFDLLCFHPYKTVVAFTEDLRTYLKSEKGQQFVERPISGQDLKPVYDAARLIVDDCIVSDIPLLYTPGQIGLACLVVAQEDVLAVNPNAPKINFYGYFCQRFEGHADEKQWHDLQKLVEMLQKLKLGNYGCGNYAMDMAALKAIHKKLKRVRIWGESKRKRKAEEGEEPQAKKIKA